MQSPPTIAVVFFGLPRCSAVTMPSIESHILGPLRRCGRVQVTYHLFRQDRIDNPRSGEVGLLSPSNYDFVSAFTGTSEPPPDLRHTIAYKAVMRRGDRWGADGVALHNALLQLHSLASAWSRVKDAQPDAVVYLRPDLLYHDPLDPAMVRHVIRHPSACVLPGWQWHHGCNDRFAICGRAAAETYATRGDQIGEWLRCHRGPFESEALLAFALRRGRVRSVAMPLRATRVRLGGRLHAEAFTCRCLYSPAVRLRLLRARIAYALICRGWYPPG